MLEKSHKHETTTAILMRISNKEILRGQLKLLNKCQDFLKIWKKGRLDIKEGDMELLEKVKPYFSQLERAKI